MTITDENWPRHPDGRRKKIGELNHAQRVAVAQGAVDRLYPEFAEQGITLKLKYPVPDVCIKCGYPRYEHSYNGACYGLCGEFKEPAP